MKLPRSLESLLIMFSYLRIMLSLNLKIFFSQCGKYQCILKYPIHNRALFLQVSEIRASIVSRVPPAITAIRRGIHLAHAAYPQRLKRIHVLGASPLMASTLQFIRSCTGEKIKKRVSLFSLATSRKILPCLSQSLL